MPSPWRFLPVAVIVVVSLTTEAPAAMAGRLHGREAYVVDGHRHALGLTFVTGPRGLEIEPGRAAIGTPYAVSGGWVACPRARRAAGFRGTPFALFGFPGARLRLREGSYRLARSFTRAHSDIFGGQGRPFALRIAVSAAVRNPALLEGDITVRGGPCTTGRPLHFRARLDRHLTVRPAP
ncbi:MAG: hypothetical protein JSS97_09395 [Actinobacteria bacterium]|nr:hypothetical protein [Actinomycetota bacterium]